MVPINKNTNFYIYIKVSFGKKFIRDLENYGVASKIHIFHFNQALPALGSVFSQLLTVCCRGDLSSSLFRSIFSVSVSLPFICSNIDSSSLSMIRRVRYSYRSYIQFQLQINFFTFISWFMLFFLTISSPFNTEAQDARAPPLDLVHQVILNLISQPTEPPSLNLNYLKNFPCVAFHLLLKIALKMRLFTVNS